MKIIRKDNKYMIVNDKHEIVFITTCIDNAYDMLYKMNEFGVCSF